MSSRVPAKQEKSATKPRQKLQGHTSHISGVLRLPDNRRIITCSVDGTLRVWDLESGMQVGKAWMGEGSGDVNAIALSPDGKTVASGSDDGMVRLWGVDTGKVIKNLTGHTMRVWSVCWSPDGGRVVSGWEDGTFGVWDVENEKIVLGPIEAVKGMWVYAVCYSPDGTMIATGTPLRVWDAITSQLLKSLDIFILCLTWASDGTTLIAGSRNQIKIFDTATWTETAVLEGHDSFVRAIPLSPNERILTSVSVDNTARLWNLDTNQPIGQPFDHEAEVNCTTFSVDGRWLVTGCHDNNMYKWDVSAIVKEAGLDHLLSDNVNTVKKPSINADPRRRAPQIGGARRPPPGFFDDFSTSHSTPSHGRRRGETERDTQSRRSPLSWAQNLLSGMLRRRGGSHLPPIVEVPLTAGKPRDYHARGKKKATSSSRPLNPPNPVQQHNGATQSTSSPQQPPAAATTSTTLPAATGSAVPAGTNSLPDITIRRAGWRTRFLLCVCCVPIQNTAGQP